MSFGDICARTDPSTYSTIEWTIDCGWTTTPMRSTSTSKSHRASMTSRPLFIIVAESIVIFGPIFHVGWRSASSTVIAENVSKGRVRNGPPEAVRTRRRTSDGTPARRAWWSAQCSESTGRTAAPAVRAARMSGSPATTSVSLFARASVLPSLTASYAGTSPAEPTIPPRTTSTSG